MAENNKYEELLGLAGEYVLGTLTNEETLEFEARMKADEALSRAVQDWQARLEPLDQTVEPLTPPKAMLGAILSQIDEAEEGPALAQIIDLTKRLNNWRRTAVMAGAIAASLLAFVVVTQYDQIGNSVPKGSYIAVLQADDKNPRFVASIDLQRGQIDIVRLGSGPQTGKVYELWAVGGGRDKPQSLGVMGGSTSASPTSLLQVSGIALDEIVFAVSLEPLGGSPTGQPTGPVLFTGKLVKIED